MQKEAESLGHSNTPIPSLEMSGTPSAPPPPPPLPQNAAPLPPRPTASKCTEKPKNGAPKKANESEHDRSALLEQIRTGGVKLKRVNNKVENAKIPDNNKNPQPKDLMTDLTKALQKRRNGIAREEENSVEMSDVFCARISSMIPPPKNQSSSSSSNNSDESWDTDDEHSILPTPQSDGEKRSESPDSSHVTTPPRSALKVEKPQVPTKPPNLRVSPQAPPAAQANNVDPTNSEMQKPSYSVRETIKIFGAQVEPCQVQAVIHRGKSSSASFLK